MTGSVLVLVEPGAHRMGGHRHRTLTALARAHGNALVIAPYGVTAETSAALKEAGAHVTDPIRALPAVLAAAGTGASSLAAVGMRAFASHRWPTAVRRLPHQVTLLARCLVEAACIRTAHRLTGDTATVVVLTASEALHGVAGLLGGPHTRFVHELVTTEDSPLRLIGRLARRGERRVAVLTPTGAVRDDLAAHFPRLTYQVRPFAVADPCDRLTDTERQQARNAFGIPTGDVSVSLVGGWWPHKAIDLIETALSSLDVPLHLLVTGAPLDNQTLDRWSALPLVRLHTVPGPAAEDQIRAVYAAADATLVARRPGVRKESGLVTDAVRLGVPLLVSDHDPDLTATLAGQGWARIFPAGDPDALAAVLRDLVRAPLPRPDTLSAVRLCLPTAAEQTAFLTRTEPKDPYR